LEKAEGLERVKVTEGEWIYSNENGKILGQVQVWCGNMECAEDEIVKKEFLEEENYRKEGQ